MLRLSRNVIIVFTLWIMMSSSVAAQPILTHYTNGGVVNRFQVNLDETRSNTVFVDISINRINLIINGNLYEFENFEIGEYNHDFDSIIILDGDYPSNIYINGSSLPFRVTVYGEGGDDFIQNNTGNRCDLRGHAGDDTLRGGPNNDYLIGGPGDDDLFGGNGNDVLMGCGGQDYLNGEGGSDDLYGNFTRNRFYKPFTGRDDRENDTLIGGNGPDRFFWATYYYQYSGQYSVKRYHEKDNIVDFQQGSDFKREIYLPRVSLAPSSGAGGGYSYQ